MNSKKILTVFVGIAIAVSIVFCGIIIGTGINQKRDVSAPTREEIHSYVLEKTKLEDFSEASITISYANVAIIPSDGYYLEYCLDGTCEAPAYNISNGKFEFKEGAVQRKYQFNMNPFGYPFIYYENQEPFYLNLYVPKEQYFELLSIYNDSGNVDIEQLQAKKAELTLDYGNLNLENFTGDSLSLTLDSGNVEFGTISCKEFTVYNDYGNLTGDNLSASTSVSAELDSGNFEVQQLSTDTFSLTNNYGNTDIYSFTSANGTFSIDSGNLSLLDADFKNITVSNDYGNADLELRQAITEYNYDLFAEYGTISVNGKTLETNDDGESSYQKDNGKDRKIKIGCDSGNITITGKY